MNEIIQTRHGEVIPFCKIEYRNGQMVSMEWIGLG